MIDIDVTKKLHYAEGELPLNIKFNAEGNGACIAVTGESGAGKTTLLRMIAGLTRPDSGYIKIDGNIWYNGDEGINISPQKRKIGMVFQGYALFPNMTVKENLLYANKDEDYADFLIDLAKMTPFANKYSSKLSGGQKQRVALIRAIANKPKLLLLDEPLSAVDAVMRRHLQDELHKIRELLKVTVIIVSHDMNEISKLAERVLVIKQGNVIQDTTDLSNNQNWF